MNGNKPVARLVNEKAFPMVRAYDNVEWYELPYLLFGHKCYSKCKREVTYEEFLAWAKARCFPPERIDAEDVLKMLGLERYDRYEIIRITGARSFTKDNFWVDFGEVTVKIDGLYNLD